MKQKGKGNQGGNNKNNYLALGIIFGAAFGILIHNIALGMALSFNKKE
jgi:hypothetical protein